MVLGNDHLNYAAGITDVLNINYDTSWNKTNYIVVPISGDLMTGVGFYADNIYKNGSTVQSGVFGGYVPVTFGWLLMMQTMDMFILVETEHGIMVRQEEMQQEHITSFTLQIHLQETYVVNTLKHLVSGQ